VEPKVAEVESGRIGNSAATKTFVRKLNNLGGIEMAGRSISPMFAFLLGVVVVGLGVLAYVLYERQHREVLRINVPGFSGEITKDKGIDIEVGKDR
jgi:hypothetical protein